MSQDNKSPLADSVGSFFVAVLIALVIRAGVVYPFRIPTPSMDGTLMVGDHILCNKFVYGIRTPDWVGIPYTRLGFTVPHTRLPGFRDPAPGDVVIFRYPRDRHEYYVKRLIAVSGDTVSIRDRTVYINGQVFQGAPEAYHSMGRILGADVQLPDIFPPGQGNIHQYGPWVIPSPGDRFLFTEASRNHWFEWLNLMYYEGAEIALAWQGRHHVMNGENIHQWPSALAVLPADAFTVNGEPLTDFVYTVQDVQYFMMGDNRDNSADSRFWGLVPARDVVGEALIKYWSWDSDKPLYQLPEKVRWNRLLGLIN